MYVCLCYGVTDRTIREHVENGARTTEEIMAATRAGTRCGSCRGAIAAVIAAATAGEREETSSVRRLPILPSDSISAA